MSASQIRAEIEAALAHRIPSALTPAPRITRPKIATGIDPLDELLKGGLPTGAITEIVGAECTGRTTLALRFLAQSTLESKVCAWVDVSDSLHPESAAAAGIDLDRLLWVRCGKDPASNINKPIQTKRDNSKIPATERLQFGGNSPHPRSENKGLPLAISDLLGVSSSSQRDTSIGTPGSANRSLGLSTAATILHSSRKEQVASDRLPARRGVYVLEQREAHEPACYESHPKLRRAKLNPQLVSMSTRRCEDQIAKPMSPWSCLEQALRVTDLLLQAGGFSSIVLDMGSIGAAFTSRIPLATWFRYRAVAEKTQCCLLMLTQYPTAKSSAEVMLRIVGSHPIEEGSTVFAGLKINTELARRRFESDSADVVSIRKPPQRVDAAEWQSKTEWAGRQRKAGQ